MGRHPGGTRTDFLWNLALTVTVGRSGVRVRKGVVSSRRYGQAQRAFEVSSRSFASGCVYFGPALIYRRLHPFFTGQ